jgi:cytochrome bd ubiquinol oxidase subunit II
MRLSDAWMIFVILAFTLYIVLDGYDLGIGVLTLLDRDPGRRRAMHQLVAWTWDGNESWIVLLALTLWGGLPRVTGTVLPALYIPLFLMLWSLIARGVALELIDQHKGWHPLWGAVFGVGSLIAGFCQGAAFGAVVAGFNLRDGGFAGGPFTFLHDGYSVLTGLTAVALYLLAGCAYVYARGDGEIRRRAAATGRVSAVTLAAGTAASWLLASSAGPVVLHPAAGLRLPFWLIGTLLLAAGLAVAASAFSTAPAARTSWWPASGVLAAYAGGLLIAGGLLYPTLVPPHITVHNAASPRSSLLFLLIGVGIFIPIILTYQTYGYRVFRGKLAAAGEMSAN